MEYSISNASVALMAKKMGDHAAYAAYRQRSYNYRQYYDPVSGFFRAKRAGWFLGSRFSIPSDHPAPGSMI